jgi:uncharacterized protein (DUF983 family)
MPRPPDLRLVSAKRMVWRGLLRRCPRCGGDGWWKGLKRVPRCGSCGYRYEREPGFSLGAITINMAFCFVVLALVLGVGIALSYPTLAVVPILIAGGLAVLVLPIVMYPVSYTVWAAFDLIMHPLGIDEAAAAEIALLADKLVEDA